MNRDKRLISIIGGPWEGSGRGGGSAPSQKKFFFTGCMTEEQF